MSGLYTPAALFPRLNGTWANKHMMDSFGTLLSSPQTASCLEVPVFDYGPRHWSTAVWKLRRNSGFNLYITYEWSGQLGAPVALPPGT
jgi:hypothetical protein